MPEPSSLAPRGNFGLVVFGVLPADPGARGEHLDTDRGGRVGVRGAADAGPGVGARVVRIAGRARPAPAPRARAVRALRACPGSSSKKCANVGGRCV